MDWQSPIRSNSKLSKNAKDQHHKTHFTASGMPHVNQLKLKTIQKQKDQSASSDSIIFSKLINTQSKIIDSKQNSFVKQLEQLDQTEIYKSKSRLSVQNHLFQNKVQSRFKSQKKQKKSAQLQRLAEKFYSQCIHQAKTLCRQLKSMLVHIRKQFTIILEDTCKNMEKNCIVYLQQYKSYIKTKLQASTSKKFQQQFDKKLKNIIKKTQKNKNYQSFNCSEEAVIENVNNYQKTHQNKQINEPFASVKQKMQKFMATNPLLQNQTSQSYKNSLKQYNQKNADIRKISHIKHEVDRSSSKSLKNLNSHIKKLKESLN